MERRRSRLLRAGHSEIQPLNFALFESKHRFTP
jgi:hypothetical protein